MRSEEQGREAFEATFPDHIWLDVGEDAKMDLKSGDTFRDLHEVTWSEDNATGYGVKYVRAPDAGEAEADNLLAQAQADGSETVAEWVEALKTSSATYFAERNSAREAYRRHRDESEARGELINIVLGLVDAPAGANVVQAVAAALSPTPSDNRQQYAKEGESAPEGWKLVPVEPTREMIDAGHMHTMRADEEEPYRARGEAIACYSDMLDAAPSPATRFSCYLERDHGKAPCDRDCGKLRCMYPSEPAVAVQAEPVWCDACSQMVSDQCPSGMCEMKKGVAPERQDPLSRTREEHSPGLAMPIVRWKNLDAAMGDPLFQALRGIMGTANYGQDDALFRVLSHFEAAHPKPAAPATADEASDVNVALEAVDVLYALTLQQSTPAQRIDAKIALKRAILALRSGASAQHATPKSLLRAPLKAGERLVCYCPPGVCQAPKGFSGPCNRAAQHAEGGAVEPDLIRAAMEKADFTYQPTKFAQALIDEMCARIKAADDEASKADYMLDSDDCISVLRGTWTTKEQPHDR